MVRDRVRYSYNGRLIESRMISRPRHYLTFNISNIANTVLYVITED